MKAILIIAIILSASSIMTVNAAGSCVGHCGSSGSAGFSCWCDSLCQSLGDCCSDFCQTCPAQINPASSWCIKPKICQASSEAVPDAWCKVYCSFNSNGECTGVAAHMTSVCECTNFNRDNIGSICISLSPAVPNSWCSTYCHINQTGPNSRVCTVDQHMSSICACATGTF